MKKVNSRLTRTLRRTILIKGRNSYPHTYTLEALAKSSIPIFYTHFLTDENSVASGSKSADEHRKRYQLSCFLEVPRKWYHYIVYFHRRTSHEKKKKHRSHSSKRRHRDEESRHEHKSSRRHERLDRDHRSRSESLKSHRHHHSERARSRSAEDPTAIALRRSRQSTGSSRRRRSSRERSRSRSRNRTKSSHFKSQHE